jgi:hypothetical protein
MTSSTPSTRTWRWALSSLAVAVLAACQPKEGPSAQAAAPAAPAAVPATGVPAITPVAYTPPTADALYQMVAPIALYPDKLVALVLAGASHPDEVTAAYGWLASNPTPQPDAVNLQPWDPSIKALTSFPNALNLLQSNLPWTTALGQAYNNDPTDVLNAIQTMRHRAQTAGHLQSNSHQRVAAASSTSYTPSATAQAVYTGPTVVPVPSDYIAIEPAQAQTVYMPSYDPAAVYGAPVAYYQGYNYHPAAVVGGISPVAVGALAFGAGVVLSAALEHHDWGWRSWDVHWGNNAARGNWQPGAPLPPQARPAVSYRQTTYVSHVSNVVNQRYVDQHNTTIINNAPAAAPNHGTAALAGAAVAGGALGAMAAHHGSTTPSAPNAPVPVAAIQPGRSAAPAMPTPPTPPMSPASHMPPSQVTAHKAPDTRHPDAAPARSAALAAAHGLPEPAPRAGGVARPAPVPTATPAPLSTPRPAPLPTAGHEAAPHPRPPTEPPQRPAPMQAQHPAPASSPAAAAPRATPPQPRMPAAPAPHAPPPTHQMAIGAHPPTPPHAEPHAAPEKRREEKGR